MWMWEPIKAAADEMDYILVAPDGVSDTGNNVSSWHIGGGGNGTAPSGDPVCDMDRQQRVACYTTTCDCKEAHPCAWTNCGDDAGFVMALVEYLQGALCIDNVFVAGASNGGMLTWDLASNPTSAQLFQAIAPMIGLPHRGYLMGPGAAKGMPVLLMTGLADIEIPPGSQDANTTQSQDGRNFMHYTSAAAISRVWAQANGCTANQSIRASVPALPTMRDVGELGVACTTHCTGDDALQPRQIDCRGPGGHEVDTTWMLQAMFPFFNQHAAHRPCAGHSTQLRCASDAPRCAWEGTQCIDVLV